MVSGWYVCCLFFFKQKTAYEMRISDGSSDVCSSDLIAASIREVGIIEPPVVVRIKGQRDRYRLLDGHIRIEILKERGDKDVVCLVATDDEAITYNKRKIGRASCRERVCPYV